ncbi:MAG: LysM peptidoglycan-binding domain-containing protein [Acidimicrobiales bacterium]
MSTTTRPTAARPTGHPTGRQIAEGLGALTVLVTGLAGIPVALAITVGWPLPHHIPTGRQVTDALRSAIPESFWPHLFATLGWLAWAYLALSVATAVADHLRGRQHSRYPRFAIQGAAAALVTAAMVLGQLRATPTVRSVAPAPIVQLLAADATQPAAVTHTVVAGDTLWGIATTYYGDGVKWPAIYQANAGVPQPDGGALSDAHWIYPGWTLVIPDATEAAPPAPPTTPATVPSPSAPAPVIRTTIGGDHHAVVHASPPVHTTIPAKVRTHPATGHRLHTDPTVRAASAPVAHHDDAHHEDAVGPRVTGGTHRAMAAGHDDDIGALAIGAGIFGVGAIGLVSALDRRRRRQSGRRARGMRIPLPAARSPLADLELQLRHYARADSLFWLTRLPDLLAHSADSAGTPRPQVLGVRASHHGLDVFVTAEAGDPPAPFESPSGEPTVWHLPYSAGTGVFGDTVVAETVPLTLATVGHGIDGTLLVNLDHYRSLHIQVDAEKVPGTLAAIGAELAGTTASSADRVVAVGVGRDVIDRLDNGIVTEDLDTAIAQLRPEEKTIILVDAAAVSGQLTDLVVGTTALRLVTAGPVAPPGVALVVDPATPTLSGHHLDAVQPTHVTDETLVDVEALLDLAEAPADSQPDDDPYRRFDVAATPLDALSDGPIVLGLLGEPTIAVGDSEPRNLLDAVSATAGTKARRVVELLVYLAAHDGTTTRGEWLTDISPDKALSEGYVRNLVLLTRRSLEAITGHPDLLAYDRTTQQLTLAENVRTDWSMFRSLTASRELEDLQSALSLVRGMPFGSNAEPWTAAAGISYVIAADISDAAVALGEHALSIGEPQLATWAARQGQLANRYDQGLWRILLRAADDKTTLQRLWQELNALLAIDGDPTADLDPTTVDLYSALNGPRSPAAEVVVLQDVDDAVIPTRQAV